MNRRAFLTGACSVAVAAAAPVQLMAEPARWSAKDLVYPPVFIPKDYPPADHLMDAMRYGVHIQRQVRGAKPHRIDPRDFFADYGYVEKAPVGIAIDPAWPGRESFYGRSISDLMVDCGEVPVLPVPVLPMKSQRGDLNAKVSDRIFQILDCAGFTGLKEDHAE